MGVSLCEQHCDCVFQMYKYEYVYPRRCMRVCAVLHKYVVFWIEENKRP